ncbi:hypothetical protein Scep_026746 [Stephania cephalantha]|uniref:Uncharacterized protein n=1 Tax=Stephania cephalantha TaxID=152367 RepID=A0AAP0HSB4_9MAGN
MLVYVFIWLLRFDDFFRSRMDQNWELIAYIVGWRCAFISEVLVLVWLYCSMNW